MGVDKHKVFALKHLRQLCRRDVQIAPPSTRTGDPVTDPDDEETTGAAVGELQATSSTLKSNRTLNNF